MVLYISDFFKYLLDWRFIAHSEWKRLICKGNLFYNLVSNGKKTDHCDNKMLDVVTEKQKLCEDCRSVKSNSSWVSCSHLSLFDIFLYILYCWHEVTLKLNERKLELIIKQLSIGSVFAIKCNWWWNTKFEVSHSTWRYRVKKTSLNLESF